MADLRNDPSLKKVPEKFKVIMTEYAENVKKNGMFTGFVYGSQAEQYIRTWNPSDQAQLKAALDEYAAKHNGVLEGFTDLRTGQPLVDPKTGKAPTPDAFLQQLGELSVNHMATVVKTPTLQVGDKKITAIGQPATEEQQKKDEEKKGWFARNWKWLTAVVAGLGAIGGLIAWLVHKNRKNKVVPIEKDKNNPSVTPTPGGDKDPDNPGKEPDNPGKDPGKDSPSWGGSSSNPGTGNQGSYPAEPGASGSGGNSGDTPGTGGGTLPDSAQDNITDQDPPSTGGNDNPNQTPDNNPNIGEKVPDDNEESSGSGQPNGRVPLPQIDNSGYYK